jgi:hypothetical protein
MSEQQYVISGQARKDMDDFKADLYRRVKFHVMTAEEAGKRFESFVHRIIALARRPVDPDSYVRIACKHCFKEYNVKLDVREFACNCQPNERQSAFLQRLALD